MKSINRRKFLKGSIGAAAMTALSRKNIVGANDKVIIGIMGIGGRGCALLGHFVKRSDIKFKYICDADTRRYGRAADIVLEEHGYKPEFVQDFRKMLADPEVDAIINATPRHWHGLGTIMACQAGKDVYVEKPPTSSIWEGRKMVEAARKYKRIVQVGTQTSSAPYFNDAVEYIRSGKLGDIHIIRVFVMVGQGSRSSRQITTEPIPEGFDYELWCGPARKLPYTSNYKSVISGWDWGSGTMTGDGIHQITLARVMIDKPYPDTVHHAGGVFRPGGRVTPDTQLATFEYDKTTLIIEAAPWTPFMKKTPMPMRAMDKFPNWLFSSMKIEVLGTEGIMFFGRHGAGWQAYDKDCEVMAFKHGREANEEHIENFINCIRSRKGPNADIEEGHISTLLCHLADISYRVGNQTLKFDSKTESFINNNEANKYLKGEYRKPWVIPDKV